MRKLRSWLLPVSFIFACCSAWTIAGDVALRADHPDEYVVQRGDTLWDISAKFLEKPWYWPEIWHVNPQVANPHLIYPGDRLRLIWKDGRPMLSLQRGTGGTVKLSPQARAIPLDQAIPAIPLDVINSFLNTNRIVDPDELELAPYVLGGADKHVVMGARDTIYARGTLEQDLPVYAVFRSGNTFIDPDTRELLGYEARGIGLARLEQVEGEVLKLRVTSSREEVRVHDRLLSSAESKVESTFYPRPPDGEVRGKVIAVSSGVTQVGPYNVVTINRGAREGMQVGTVLAIHRSGEMVRDHLAKDVVQLPSERAGLMMVFRVYDKVSYGLVLKAHRPLAVLDEVRNP